MKNLTKLTLKKGEIFNGKKKVEEYRIITALPIPLEFYESMGDPIDLDKEILRHAPEKANAYIPFPFEKIGKERYGFTRVDTDGFGQQDVKIATAIYLKI